jgi:hypothetical protein
LFNATSNETSVFVQLASAAGVDPSNLTGLVVVPTNDVRRRAAAVPDGPD